MRKYTEELLQGLRDSAVVQMHGNLKMISKHAPDAAEPAAIDPRLMNGKMGKMLKLLPWIPKAFMTVDTRPENIPKLRAGMNVTLDGNYTENPIQIDNRTVTAKDGYPIPIRIYSSVYCGYNCPCLYYMHGGGLIAGTLDMYDEALKMFVDKNHMVVVSVDYRLLPENPYPTPHEDCLDVLYWIYHNTEMLGVSKYHIFVCGDSGGGNVAQYCSTKTKGTSMVRGQLLLYPSLNMFLVEDKYYKFSLDQFAFSHKERRIAKKLIEIGPSTMNATTTILNVVQPDEFINPYIGNPEGNPPTFFAFGELDFLKLDSIGWAHKLQDAGVETRVIVYKGLAHGFLNAAGSMPQAEDCIEEMGMFIREHC